MGLLSVCDSSFHMGMCTVVKDSLNGGVLKKKKQEGKSDTTHKSHFFCVKSVGVCFFTFCLFSLFIMCFYVFVSKDCVQLVLEEKCCGNGVVGHFVVTLPFSQPD